MNDLDATLIFQICTISVSDIMWSFIVLDLNCCVFNQERCIFLHSSMYYLSFAVNKAALSFLSARTTNFHMLRQIILRQIILMFYYLDIREKHFRYKPAVIQFLGGMQSLPVQDDCLQIVSLHRT